MTVRRKVFIILALSIGLLLLFMAGATRVFFARSSETQDRTRIRDNALRLKAVFDNELDGLDRQVTDYASWDDTYAFIRKPENAYIESNVVLSTFDNNRLRFMVFLDARGRSVLERAFDIESELAVPLPAGLKEHLGPGSRLLEHPDPRAGVTGLLALPDGYYLVASRPILTSNFAGPPAGTLIFGRRLDESLLRSFERILLLSVKLKPAVGRALEEDFAAGGVEGLFVRVLDPRTLEGETLVRDIDGRPALALSFVQERIFRANFLRTLGVLLAGLAGFSLIVLIVVLWMLDRHVTGRLSRLFRFVKEVEVTGNLDQRVDVGGRDEISRLAGATNTLLATLQAQIDQTREAEVGVRASEAKYLALFEASPDAILLETIDGRILDCNGSALRLLGFEREEFVGMDITRLLSAERRLELPDFQKKFMAEGRGFVKVRVATKSGERIPIEVSIRMSRIGTENRLIVHGRDLRPEERAEAVKSALYEISQAASGAADLATLYALIRKTITALLPYPNFYIALIDEPTGWITFPLFIDEYDAPPAGRPLGHGLPEYVFRSGQPLLTSSQNTLALRDAGEVDLLGQLAVDWLGVPLKTAEAKIGVMAIQTYRPEARIGEEEKTLLLFLSAQVAMAIERVRARERLQASLGEKEALLREIHHRVKNNLQIISSLLNLQAGSIHDQEALESIRECQSRIRSMSLVHEKLYQSQNLAQIQFADYIQSLATHLFHFWRIGADRIRLETDLDPVVLDINTAIPGGLIVNEMISNALEHAFPDGRAGTVRITLRDLGSETYEIVVRDDGVGLPEGFDPAAAGTLGLQLIDLLARQLGGEVRLTRDGGTSVAVTFKEQKTRPRA